MAGPIGPSTLCSIPSHGIVEDIFIGFPSALIALTVRLIPVPSTSNTWVLSFSIVPGVPLDFAGFSFHVPRNGLSAAIRATQNKQNAVKFSNLRIRIPSLGCRTVYRRQAEA